MEYVKIKKTVLTILLVFFCNISAALRIISLAPNLTEMLFNIGAGSEVVAVDTASDTPQSVKHLPQVADYQHINLEKIIALHPDEVVAVPMSIQQEQLAQLKKSNIPVYYIQSKKLADIAGNLQELGRLTHHEKIANQVASEYLKKLTDLKNKYQHQKSITVFYEVWQQPLFTITPQSVVGQILNLCQAKTIFPESLTTSISLEAVIQRKPEMIIITNSNNAPLWKKWLPQSRIIVVSADQTQRFAPSVLEGAAQLCSEIYS